jgi:hypothetical protein
MATAETESIHETVAYGRKQKKKNTFRPEHSPSKCLPDAFHITTARLQCKSQCYQPKKGERKGEGSACRVPQEKPLRNKPLTVSPSNQCSPFHRSRITGLFTDHPPFQASTSDKPAWSANSVHAPATRPLSPSCQDRRHAPGLFSAPL